VGSGLEDQRDGQRSRRGKPRDAVVTEGVDSVACGLRVKRGILAAVGLCTKGICSPASPSPQGCASPGPTAALLFMGRKPDLCLIAAPLLNGRQGGLRSRSGGAHRSERAEISRSARPARRRGRWGTGRPGPRSCRLRARRSRPPPGLGQRDMIGRHASVDSRSCRDRVGRSNGYLRSRAARGRTQAADAPRGRCDHERAF
jgi:hypothetical protein